MAPLECIGYTAEMDDTEPKLQGKEASPIAKDLKRVRDAALDAAAKRDKLPQPLFWSLFFTELNAVKREREQIRHIEEALSKLG